MKVYIVRGWRDSGEDHLAAMSTQAKAAQFKALWLRTPAAAWHEPADVDWVELEVDDWSGLRP